MAMKKSYYSISGELIGEAASGVRTGYLRDALGSVTATVDEAGTVENTYRYKPYGAQLSKSGAGADPKFRWLGLWGYRSNSTATVYVRARHYGSAMGSWLAVDVHWPDEHAYAYANSNSVNYVDPSAKRPILLDCAKCSNDNTENFETELKKVYDALCDGLADTKKRAKLIKCIKDCNTKHKRNVDIDCLDIFCNREGVWIYCKDCEGEGRDDVIDCPPGCPGCPKVTVPPCATSNCAPTLDFKDRSFTTIICCDASTSDLLEKCNCPEDFPDFGSSCDRPGANRVMRSALHELAHHCSQDCAPDSGGGGDKNSKWGDCVKKCLGLGEEK